MVSQKSLAELQAENQKLLDRIEAIEADAESNDGGVMTAEQVKEYKELSDKLDSLDKQIKDAEELEALRRKNADRRKQAKPQRKTTHDGPSGSIGNPKANFADDPKRGFKTPAEFLYSVIDATTKGAIDDERLKFCTAGSDEQSTFADPYGGYLLPEGFAPGLLSLQAEMDPTAGLTRSVPMTTKSLKINARTDKNHSSSVTGGLTVSRRAEGDSSSSSRMEIEQVKLELHDLYGLSYATEELLMESPVSFAALLAAGFRDEFGAKVIDEKINGTGVGEMEGVLASPALVSVAKEGGQAANTIVGANIVKMTKRCWNYGRAVWLANHDTYEQLVQAHLALTNTDLTRFFSMTPDGTAMLNGRPLYMTEYCKTLGTKGDLILGVWSEYLEATRGGIQQAESVHVRFLQNERTFRFIAKNDGRCWWRSALTPKNSSSTLSPFVALNTRS